MISAWAAVSTLLFAPAVYRDATALVSFDPPPADFEPPMAAEPADSWRRASGAQGMFAAFVRYPPKMTTKFVRHVYLVPNAVSGKSENLSGFYRISKRSLVLSIGADPKTFLLGPVYATYHHEFAHAVNEQFGRFPNAEWERANPKGFRYGVVKSQDTNPDPSLHALGFYSPYCQTELREDFAVVAEHVMDDNPAFWAACRLHPNLAAKARLVAVYYRRAYPGFRIPHAPKDIIPD